MNHKRVFGEFLTNIEIFEKYIFPYIKKDLYNYTFVDFYGGEGNLILPILKQFPEKNRNNYFKEHIFLFDIQQNLIDKAIKNAVNLGIDLILAKKILD